MAADDNETAASTTSFCFAGVSAAHVLQKEMKCERKHFLLFSFSCDFRRNMTVTVTGGMFEANERSVQVDDAEQTYSAPTTALLLIICIPRIFFKNISLSTVRVLYKTQNRAL